MDNRRNDPETGRRGCLMYKIRYTGWGDYMPDWQPYWDAAGCPHLVADFHHRNSSKPGPHASFKRPEDWEPLLAYLVTELICTGKRTNDQAC